MENKLMLILKLIIVGMTVGMISSCKEDLNDTLPADGKVAYVNFVNAGEAFLHGTDEMLYRDNRVYINDSVNNAPFDKYTGRRIYPIIFRYEEGGYPDIRQYPYHLTGVPEPIDNTQADVFWMPFKSGTYNFIYTSKDRTYLSTTRQDLGNRTYNFLYLVESPEANDAYTVVHVPIDRKERKDGVITVQLVNLSPDAGDVDLYRIDKDGNEIVSELPKGISFGKQTSVDIPISGTEATYKRILLRFRKAGGGDLQSIGIPAENGAVYTLLLRGFVAPTERKVKKDNSNMATVNVPANIRCSLRRVFY